jgi:hypothetical protein
MRRRDEIERMRFATDEYGNRRMSVDPAYRKQVEQLERQTYGDKPHRQIVRGATRPAGRS